MTTKAKCKKCGQTVLIKIEYGKSIAQMLKDQHKCGGKK